LWVLPPFFFTLTRIAQAHGQASAGFYGWQELLDNEFTSRPMPVEGMKALSV
jgi:hypothetical protein